MGHRLKIGPFPSLWLWHLHSGGKRILTMMILEQTIAKWTWSESALIFGPVSKFVSAAATAAPVATGSWQWWSLNLWSGAALYVHVTADECANRALCSDKATAHQCSVDLRECSFCVRHNFLSNLNRSYKRKCNREPYKLTFYSFMHIAHLPPGPWFESLRVIKITSIFFSCFPTCS